MNEKPKPPPLTTTPHHPPRACAASTRTVMSEMLWQLAYRATAPVRRHYPPPPCPPPPVDEPSAAASGAVMFNIGWSCCELAHAGDPAWMSCGHHCPEHDGDMGDAREDFADAPSSGTEE